MNLGRYFTLEEMLVTNTGLPNDPTTDAPERDLFEILRNLTLHVSLLDVARGILGGPIIVTSGWRSEAVNAIVGGHPRSWHKEGFASDLKSPLGQARLHEALKAAVVQADGKLETIRIYQGAHIHIGWKPGWVP